ncbi:hypothetical protein LTS18_002786, partial [Coniosporium uncinatum]
SEREQRGNGGNGGGSGTLFAPTTAGYDGDIVQKILPTINRSALASDTSPPLHEDNLVIWTGDGKLGLVGFGRRGGTAFEGADGFGADADGLGKGRGADEEKEEKEQRERRDYGERMRRALEAQARDVRVLRGLGLGGGSW